MIITLFLKRQCDRTRTFRRRTRARARQEACALGLGGVRLG
jgi:hypothetical protein